MKLLFLLLLCVLVFFQREVRLDIRFYCSPSTPIASFVESIFITFCHRKYLNRRILYSSSHRGTFNAVVITNKEVHMVHSNINKDKFSHTTSNAKKRSLKISAIL